MAAKKARVIAVQLVSMAMTGFSLTMRRPRKSKPFSMIKYDPIVRQRVLFCELAKKRK